MSTHPDACTQFPYSDVESSIDGPPSDPNELRDAAYSIAARGAHEYMRWLILGPSHAGITCTQSPYMPIIAKRAVAAAWVIDPSLFAGRSMRHVARAVGMSKSQLDTLILQFSFIFRMHGRGQMPVSRRALYISRPTNPRLQRADAACHRGRSAKSLRGRAKP